MDPHALTLSYHELLFVSAAIDVAARREAAAELALIQRCPELTTAFHSSAVPQVQLHAFLHHIAQHSGYGADGLAMSIGIMARYIKTAGRVLSGLTMHRLAAASMQVGMKATDIFIKNSYFAPMAGIPLSEFNYLEVEILTALGYRGIPSRAELTDLPEALLSYATACQQNGTVPSFADIATYVSRHATDAFAVELPPIDTCSSLEFSASMSPFDVPAAESVSPTALARIASMRSLYAPGFASSANPSALGTPTTVAEHAATDSEQNRSMSPHDTADAVLPSPAVATE